MEFGKAENFILRDQYGNDFELYRFLKINSVLLIFYPKDNSLVCSKQLKNYQQNIEKFINAGIQPVGINIESEGSHKSFCELKGIQFPVLADIGKMVSGDFKALNLFNLNRRKLVLINSSKEIVYEEMMSSLNYLKTDEILQRLKSLYII